MASVASFYTYYCVSKNLLILRQEVVWTILFSYAINVPYISYDFFSFLKELYSVQLRWRCFDIPSCATKESLTSNDQEDT